VRGGATATACVLLSAATALAQAEDPDLARESTTQKRAKSRAGWLMTEELELKDAPTSPGVAVASGAVASLTGATLVTGYAVLSSNKNFDSRAVVGAAVLGGLLLALGPNLGDILNGDGWRTLGHTLGRVAVAGLSALLATLPGVGVLLAAAGVVACLVWTIYDVAASEDAPARWVARNRG
jgi:hypothetical protein